MAPTITGKPIARDGMGAQSLATRVRQPVFAAKLMLEEHRRTYETFWKWSEAAVDFAMLYGSIHTVFGWRRHVGSDENARSLANFPMQANGAEMLRLACMYVTEAGIRLCAPVHDAILVEAPLGELDDVVAWTQTLMARASEHVLGGFRLRSEAKMIRHPERYMDDRGRAMWDAVQDVLAEIQAKEDERATGR